MSPFDYQTDIFFCEYYQLAQRSMGNTEFHESVDITLGCIYGLLALMSIGLLYLFLKKKSTIKPNYVLLCQLLALKIVRCIYLFLPNSVWMNLDKNISHIVAESIVYLLPELLFVSIALLLVCVTISLFIHAMTMKPKIPRHYMWIVYLVAFGIALLGAIILFIVIAVQAKTLNYRSVTLWEGIYIGTTSALIGLSCIVLGFGLFIFFRKMNILPSYLKSTPKRVVILTLIILWCAIFKAIFVIKFHDVTFYYLIYQQSDVLVWLFYLMLTEIIPLFAVLIVLFTWPTEKRKSVIYSLVELNNSNISNQNYKEPLIEDKLYENVVTC